MSSKLQTARKNHDCDECGKKILKGTRYWRESRYPDLPDRKEHINCEQLEKPHPKTGL